MVALIPAIGTASFDSTGERRLAERLEQKLDADYLQWHNVPIGSKQTHPDFVVLPGVGHMPAPGEDELEAARVFYVAATRATLKSVMGVDGGVWTQARIMTTKSRHFICRNTPCPPL
jgi:hypothetical protein